MNILRTLSLFCLPVVCSAAMASGTAAPPIRVLIVDGFSNHDWKLTTQLMRGVIEPTGLFAVEVSTSPAKADAPGWDTWRPRFAGHDVVIQNCNDIGGGPQWPEAVRKDFVDYVRAGGGVFIFHSANNAFPGWNEYDQIIGLAWRPREYGWAISVKDDGTLERIPPGEGRNTSHGPRGNVLVHRLGEHPIHAGLPQTWMTPGLEVYYFARGPAENLTVLSYGFDPRTQQNWPLEWTVNFGAGRVYNATFGHVWTGDTQPESMRCAGVQTILVRALQWLAKRDVTWPVPADFPGAEAVSIRPAISPPE